VAFNFAHRRNNRPIITLRKSSHNTAPKYCGMSTLVSVVRICGRAPGSSTRRQFLVPYNVTPYFRTTQPSFLPFLTTMAAHSNVLDLEAVVGS
jgi:hypothetical protein